MFTFLAALATLLSALVQVRLDDHSSNLISAIVGGIIGALAGGIPAYALARLASKETKRREDETRLSADVGLLYSAAQRLIEITNGLFTICLQFNEQLDEAAVSGNREIPLHGILKPMTGIGDEDVRFSTDEIALFFRGDQSDFANDLMLISRRYAANMRALQAYSDRREDFTKGLMPTKFEDGVGTIELAGEAAIRARATGYALNQMAENILSKFNEDRRKATELSTRFGEVAKLMYPDSRVPGLNLVTH